MKYLKSVWGFMMCVVLASACGDKDLVKFDNIEGVKNWTPDVTLPLITADYDVWKLVNQYDEDADVALKDGKIVIRHELKDIYDFDVNRLVTFPTDFAQLAVRFVLPDMPGGVPSTGSVFSHNETTGIHFIQGELKKVKASFRLHYTLPETHYPFKFTLVLANAFDEAGNPIEIKDKESVGGAVDDYVDLENVVFDMSAQPNTIAWELKVALEGGILLPAGETYLDLGFKLENFSFEEAVGNLPAQSLTIPSSDFNLGVDFWDKLKGEVTLMDPRIDVIVADTGLMVPFSVQMNFDLYGDNKHQRFEGGPLKFEWQNENETQTQSYDATNSNIADLIYFPPTNGVEYSGTVRINPEGKEVTVKKDGKANIGVYIEVPLGLASSDMMFNDTVKCGKVDSDVVDKLLLARIRVSAVNNIPLELGEGSLFLLDDNYRCIDVVDVEKFIDAPEVDDSGHVIAAAQGTNLIPLSESNIENLVNTEYIVISVKAKTSNQGRVPVEIKPEATIHLNLNLEVRFTFEEL